MNQEDVRLVTVEPMRVASFHGFGRSPEREAMRKLIAWAEPRGLLHGERRARVFGFNNPSPSPGSPHYGYELWLELGPDVVDESETEIKAFAGGQYAVLRCHALPDGSNIPATWEKLVMWQEASPYRYPRQQPCLEEFLSSLTADEAEFALDLYLPVARDE